jgi:hypothetical protein
VYAPVLAYLAATGRAEPELLLRLSEPLEKVAASSMAAAAVALMYLTLRRRTTAKAALWIALGFAFCTSMWATASQMLWQHGGVALALSAGLLLLTWPALPSRACLAAGAVLAFGFAVRPTAALFFLAGLVSILMMAKSPSRWHRAAWYLVGGAPVLAATLAYNVRYFSHPLGGYSVVYNPFSATRALVGFAGLLVSPNRGLLVFTPIALLGAWGLLRACRRQSRDRLLVVFGAASVASAAAAGSYIDWHGGWSFGPRYLVDVLPVLALACAAVEGIWRPWPRALVGAALVWSLLVQLDGNVCYPASNWNGRMGGEGLDHAAWSWRHFELAEDFLAWNAAGRGVAPY